MSCREAMIKTAGPTGRPVWVCVYATCVRSDAHRHNHCTACGAAPLEVRPDDTTAALAAYRCANGHLYEVALQPATAVPLR